jgi:hypothetical protein
MENLGLIEKYKKQVEAEKLGERLPKSDRVGLKEALSAPDLSVILHRTIIDTIKDNAEPLYIASKMLRPVRITEGRSIIFPAMSDMVADYVSEGGNYPEAYPDVEIFEGTSETSVKKVGLIVRITDEMIADAQWDVVSILLEKAGRAMGRFKEEWCFREFTRHGHVIFDPVYDASLASGHADKGKFATHGLGSDYKTANDTLSVQDFLDLLIGNIANGYQTTDIFMHPLVWPIFAKNPILDKLSIAAFGGQNNTISVSPGQVQGKLPFAVNITLTPFVPFNLDTERFDMYIVDRNEVGFLLVKNDITTEQWDNPERDIRAMKIMERYAPGILNNGKGISVAKNIAFKQTWAEPDVIRTIS